MRRDGRIAKGSVLTKLPGCSLDYIMKAVLSVYSNSSGTTKASWGFGALADVYPDIAEPSCSLCDVYTEDAQVRCQKAGKEVAKSWWLLLSYLRVFLEHGLPFRSQHD